jgi:hypothetical protein
MKKLTNILSTTIINIKQRNFNQSPIAHDNHVFNQRKTPLFHCYQAHYKVKISKFFRTQSDQAFLTQAKHMFGQYQTLINYLYLCLIINLASFFLHYYNISFQHNYMQ